MASKYSDYISVREQRAAYNIEDEKTGDWATFIANSQFNGILRNVITSVRNNDASMHKSFWIEGTYGTGKSHAASVIKHLLSDSVEEVKKYTDREFESLELRPIADQLLQLRQQKKLFPVQLYGQSKIAHLDDLSLVLQQKVVTALSKSGIKIAVKTDFESYAEHMEQNEMLWDNLIARDATLSSIVSNRKSLIAQMRNCDTGTYETMKDALRNARIDIRLEASSLKQWFFEVQEQLRKTTDYSGILVVWDEFTDVMNSPMGMSLLVALQEIDEMVMNPENDSYFLYISHPSALNSMSSQEREKTKGRYHYMKYNMEPVSAYKIMSRKFEMVSGQDKSVLIERKKQFISDTKEVLEKYSLGSNSPQETLNDLTSLFPLHPGTAHLATYYAREVGSSSRSVFQFLGENPAIKNFLNDPDHFDNYDLITADYLWDYVVEEFNSDVSRYGVVTERYNSRRLDMEAQGPAFYAVFKGILLLNALNNVANSTAVTPVEENIRNLFIGTRYENEVDNALVYMDEKSIIQRQPGDLFSIQFSALPQKEITSIIEQMQNSQFAYLSQVLESSKVMRDELNISLKGVHRACTFGLFSVDRNDFTLKSQIENGRKCAHPYELYLAFLFSRNRNDYQQLTGFAEEVSREERFANVAFFVIEEVMEDKNYQRFIEYMANAECASRHGFAEQQSANYASASDMIREWSHRIKKGNFICYLIGERIDNSAIRIASTINLVVASKIFYHGPESLESIRINNSNPCWKCETKKTMVDNIMSYNTKGDIVSNCGAIDKHIPLLFQDSLNEDLTWKDDVDPNHPLKVVCDKVKRTLDHVDKNGFNLGDALSWAKEAPYGLYKTTAGMGMIAFALRPYIDLILDTNGKPRSNQHLVTDIVEMFTVWESNRTSSKLNFRFESVESRKLCSQLIKVFKMNESEVSSLANARWEITHRFSEKMGFPLWSLKHASGYNGIMVNEKMAQTIDDILEICNSERGGQGNIELVKRALDGLRENLFDLAPLLHDKVAYNYGFVALMKSIPDVDLKDHEVEDAIEFIHQNTEATVGLWEEERIKHTLMSWRIRQNKPEFVEIKVEVNPAEGGFVYGGGRFDKGAKGQIAAVPNKGYVFKEWIGIGSTEHQITLTYDHDECYTARFVQEYSTGDPGKRVKIKEEDLVNKRSEAKKNLAKFTSVSELTMLLLKIIDKEDNPDILEMINK